MGMKIFASGVNFSAVTASDSETVNCKALYVGTGGTITLKQSASGDAVAFVSVQGGSILPIELKNGLVMSTGTTASDVVKLDW